MSSTSGVLLMVRPLRAKGDAGMTLLIVERDWWVGHRQRHRHVRR
jgi:hypothetical protein